MLPEFAVVGHPNKGKSSIVATLTRQDAVNISEISGTTTRAQAFQLHLFGQAQYSLFDTPGFQRPRQVLSWLQSQSVNAAERPQAVKDFIAQQTSSGVERFQDEVELLSPIMSGAGIIYVVDGSTPYTPEFEAEMTILQWTGQPRMALINPIGGEAYVSEWQRALSQFFSVVRVFDPMTADDRKQQAVLSAFAELHEPWRGQLEQTLNQLSNYTQQLRQQGAQIVAEHWLKAMMHQQTLKVPASFARSSLEHTLKTRYQQALQDIESSMRSQLQTLFAHPRMQHDIEQLSAEIPDLFDQSTWYLFGLDRQKIIGLTTSAGAAAGAVIDVGLGGASLMTGALAGGLVSGVASIAATWKPDRLKIKGVPVAGEQLLAGPVKNVAFAFVLLGRALDYLETLALRTHADRRVFRVTPISMNDRLSRLSKVDQVKLTAILQKAHKGLNDKDLLQLKDWISQLLQKPDTP